MPRRCVLIGAPHTSNWDFPLTLLALSSMGIRFNWVAKHTLFRWPLGAIFSAIGGIPVDRSSGAQLLMRVLDLYEERSDLILAIAPEGTRSKTRYWKTGFYAMATRASVPIALGYIDYQQKRVGIGKLLEPAGDLISDFRVIEEFYRDKKGKILANQGDVCIEPSKKKR